MGTAEEHVHSAWQENTTGGDDERKTLLGDRPASPEVHLLRAVKEWKKELSERVES
jgi:hypothetical protein